MWTWVPVNFGFDRCIWGVAMGKLSGAGLTRLRITVFLSVISAVCMGLPLEAGQLAGPAFSPDRPTVGVALETESKILFGNGTLIVEKSAVIRELRSAAMRCGAQRPRDIHLRR